MSSEKSVIVWRMLSKGLDNKCLRAKNLKNQFEND
nr:MAG TPA: hypothetical protein [Caudoviricetes sp.]